MKSVLGERWLLAVAPRVFIPFLQFLRWSSKVEINGREHLESAFGSGRPVILAAWHGSLAHFALLRLHVPMPLIATMVSKSRDGEIGAALVRALGGDAVRASSSRGGAAGLLALHNRLLDRSPGGRPFVGFHALDGPRGPRHRAKPGILLLARRADALIVPIVAGSARAWEANSWDRQRIPLPLGRIVYCIGEPIDVRAIDGGDGRRPAPKAAPARFSIEDLEKILLSLSQSHPLCSQGADPG